MRIQTCDIFLKYWVRLGSLKIPITHIGNATNNIVTAKINNAHTARIAKIKFFNFYRFTVLKFPIYRHLVLPRQ